MQNWNADKSACDISYLSWTSYHSEPAVNTYLSNRWTGSVCYKVSEIVCSKPRLSWGSGSFVSGTCSTLRLSARLYALEKASWFLFQSHLTELISQPYTYILFWDLCLFFSLVNFPSSVLLSPNPKLFTPNSVEIRLVLPLLLLVPGEVALLQHS